MGNMLWNSILTAAYLGPETWLTWADGSAAGKTVADLYRWALSATMMVLHGQESGLV